MLITKFDTTNIVDKLIQFENEKSIKLPIAYREFLMKYNGGITICTSFRINKTTSDIVGFYGLGDVEYSFDEFEKTDMLVKYVEKGILPIAYNDFGDKIVIGIKENSGKIYFIYHDKEEMVELTSEFGEFVKKCKSEKIGHIPSIEERKKMMIDNGLGDKITEESIKGWQEEKDEYKNIRQEKVIL